mgnify:CR=1 FL=1
MAGHIETAGSVIWNTPIWIIDTIKEVFGEIDLDPCSNDNSVVGALKTFQLPYQDGLAESWDDAGVVFVNSPFGTSWNHKQKQEDGRTKLTCISAKEFKELSIGMSEPEKAQWYKTTVADWIRKCANTKGSSVIKLCPVAIGTTFWHSEVFPKATAIFFPKGRLKFLIGGETRASAPMDCCLILWTPPNKNIPYGLEEAFRPHGKVIIL